jgi:hypothetical protein
MKLSKSFTCVLAGEIYPIEIEAGEECPPEHEDSAHAQGCVDDAEYEAGVALRPTAEEPEPALVPEDEPEGEPAPEQEPEDEPEGEPAPEQEPEAAPASSQTPKKSRG